VFIVKVPLNDGTLDGTLDDAAQKTVEKTVEKILDIIKKKPEITQDQIAEIVGISRRGIEWNLKKLKESGILKRVGGRKSGHWEIIER
jgi:ATP-dependent DNA helicase RecG